MTVDFISQQHEDRQFGPVIFAALNNLHDVPRRVVIVSAFASLVSVNRLKDPLATLQNLGCAIRVVVGVDMGGTSKEVLEELACWPCEVLVFKNRRPGVTFHPKIYLLEWETSAQIFVGSNNLTDGGLYSNYEATAQTSYSLPADVALYTSAQEQLRKFIDPQPPLAQPLTTTLLGRLLARRDIPSESEVRKRRKAISVGPPARDVPDETFGYEATRRPPPLPVSYQQIVLAANSNQMEQHNQRRRRGEVPTEETVGPLLVIGEPLAQLQTPTSFFMELNATKGNNDNIPGEQRVPLEAIWSTTDFWGWRESYTRDVNPRKGDTDDGGEDRVYWNYRTLWDISQVGDPARHVQKVVRMYYYENSSDFRIYVSDLVKWGEPGDIIRLTLLAEGPVAYRCELAKRGSETHAQWREFCTMASERTARIYGFA